MTPAIAIAAIIGALLGILLGLVCLLILGLVLQWLWNSTLPDVIGVKPISPWQAIKIMLISALLFGGHRVVTYQLPPQEMHAIETDMR